MTIYKDEKETEKITLHELKTKDEMHAMFQEKGFVKLPPEELKRKLASREPEKKMSPFSQDKIDPRLLRREGLARKKVELTKTRQEDELLEMARGGGGVAKDFVSIGVLLAITAVVVLAMARRNARKRARAVR